MRVSLWMAALATLVALAMPATVEAAGGPSVTGGGLTSFAIPGAIVVMQVSVNAVEQGNGTVSGHLNFKVLSPDFGFEIYGRNRVQCLEVQDNQATLSGVCRKGVDPHGADITGQCWVARLWDNGQGRSAMPDFGTGPFYMPCSALPGQIACRMVDELPGGGEMVTGNIRVKP